MSDNCFDGVRGHVEWTKLRRKVLYHFAIFAIVDKILIIKNCRKLVFNNFILKYYKLYRKITRDKNCLFSSHRALRIFLEFFQNFLTPYFLMLKMRKYSNKKSIKKF